MASRAGPRPPGTDGSDFWHRESIAWQHKQSSINKSRLKFDIAVHLMLSFLMSVRLLPGLVSFVGVSFLPSVLQWDVPAPRPWEYAWFVSTVAALLGWKSMHRNERLLIKQFMIGTAVFGILPVLYGMFEQGDDLWAYIMEKTYSSRFLGFPAVLIWFMFLAVVAQIHAFGMYFAIQLIRAWRPRGSKLKTR